MQFRDDVLLQQTTVQPVVDEVALIVKARTAGQTTSLQEWRDTGDVVRSRVNQEGNLIFANARSVYFDMAAGNQGYVTGTTANDLDIRGGSSGIRFLNNAGSTALLDMTDAGATTLAGASLTLSTGALILADLAKITTASPINKVYTVPSGSTATIFTYNPVSRFVWHDLLAFNRWWGTPTFETYDAVGAVWGAGTLNNGLWSQLENQAITVIDGTTKTAARWTWNSSNVSYSYVEWWLINTTYSATASSKNFLIESSVDGVAWTTRHTSTGSVANAAPVLLYMSSNSGDAFIRLTITVTNSLPLLLSSIRAFSARWGNQGGGAEYSLPYNWDATQRMAIGPAAVVANGNLTVGTNTTEASGGIYFGTDTALFRNGSNVLRTNGTFLVGTSGQFAVAPTGLTAIATSTGGPILSVTEVGGSYANANAAIEVNTQNPTGTANFLYKGKLNGTDVFKVRADGRIESSGGVLSDTYQNLAATGPNLAMGATTVSVNAATGVTNHFSLASADSHVIRMVSSMLSGSYNPLVTTTGDCAIIYSNGTSGTGNLVIAPWNGVAGGIRMDSGGNVAVTGTLSATGALTGSNFSGPATTVVGATTFGLSSVVGTSVFMARQDHSHGTPTDPVTAHAAAGDPHTGYLLESVISALATPAIVLGTAAAAGSGTTPIRHNATIAAFDATAPSTQAFGDTAVVGSVAFAARRDHKHAMPVNPVTAHVATAHTVAQPVGVQLAAGVVSTRPLINFINANGFNAGVADNPGAGRTDVTLSAAFATPTNTASGDVAAAGAANAFARGDHLHGRIGGDTDPLVFMGGM